MCQEVEWVPRIVGQWEENEHVVAHSRTSERTLGYERAVGYETTFVSPQTQVQGRDPVRYRAVASRHSVASPRVGEVGVTTLDTKYDATRRPTPRAYPPEVVVRCLHNAHPPFRLSHPPQSMPRAHPPKSAHWGTPDAHSLGIQAQRTPSSHASQGAAVHPVFKHRLTLPEPMGACSKCSNVSNL